MMKQMMLTVVGAMVVAGGSLAFAGEGGKCHGGQEADQPSTTQPAAEKKGCGHCKEAKPADSPKGDESCEKAKS